MRTSPTLSICICTRDRPTELQRCLESISAGSRLPTEVIVSDDGRGESAEHARQTCARFGFVRYVEGPGAGLCANRNHAVRACRSSHVSLLDDDAVVGPSFVEDVFSLIADADPWTIFTGDMVENGHRWTPRNPSFWGHFDREPQGTYRTILLCSNVFPRRAFDLAVFDGRIQYGYEDMDLCQNLLSRGFAIRYVPRLLTEHIPGPKADADLRQRQRQRARFLTGLKRYWLWERRYLLAIAFIAAAPVHQALHHLIRSQPRLAVAPFVDMFWATTSLLTKARRA